MPELRNPTTTRPLRRRLAASLPALLYMALIFGLSSMSHPPIPEILFRLSDKVLHAILYAGLALTVLWALTDAGRRAPGWKTLLATTLFALVYGITDELHQRFVPGRSFEIADMLADMVGGLLASIAVWAWCRLRARRLARRADVAAR